MTDAAKKRLRRSLDKFGYVGGIVANKRPDGTLRLVGGHHRIAQIDALEGHCDYKITVSLVELTEAEERELNITLNNKSMQGEMDIDALATVIGEIKTYGGNVADTGFSDTDLALMLGDSFVSDVFREQTEAENPIIDQLNEMRDAGKRFDGQRERELAEDREDLVPQHTVRTPTERAEDSKADQKAELNAKREKYKESRASSNAADTIVCIIFKDPNDIPGFLESLGFDPRERYLEAEAFMQAAGFEVAEEGDDASELDHSETE